MTMTLGNIRDIGIIGIKTWLGEGLPIWVFICGIIAGLVIGYLMGSLNFAIIISKVKYRDDIRKYGSGNAGMTNMMRTYGRAAGICTFLGDLLKGVVAILLVELLFGETCAYVTGMACVIGHAFPCWYQFRGGKGVAVTAAMVLTLEPIVFLVVLVMFIIVVLFTKYISLGSMAGAFLYPLVLNRFFRLTHQSANVMSPGIITLCSVIIALLILFLHRENMKRLLNGTENKFSFKKKGTNSSDTEVKNINKD